MRNILQSLADRIAGRDREADGDHAAVRTELLKSIQAGELEADYDVIKAQLTEREVPEDQQDDLAYAIVKAALPGADGAREVETRESDPLPDLDLSADDLQRGQELLEQFDTRLGRIEKAVGQLEAFAPAFKTIGSALSLIIDDSRDNRREIGLIKSDIQQYLGGVESGAKPVDRAAPAATTPQMSADEIRLIKKGISDGRFGALEVNAYVKSGMREPSDAMRDYLAEHRR